VGAGTTSSSSSWDDESKSSSSTRDFALVTLGGLGGFGSDEEPGRILDMADMVVAAAVGSFAGGCSATLPLAGSGSTILMVAGGTLATLFGCGAVTLLGLRVGEGSVLGCTF
jgi:hypothetical protein